MKGIILAGGSGTRLYLATLGISKQLLPVYDKPMIYYSLSTFMLAGIREILIITTPEDSMAFQRILGDGRQWGMEFNFVEQNWPRGLADAFILGEDLIKGSPVCLMLGDNIYFGQGLKEILQESADLKSGCLIFAYFIRDPRHYGVVEFNSQHQVISIEESRISPNPGMPNPAFIFTVLKWWTLLKTSNLQPGGSWRLRTPIKSISNEASSLSSCWPVGMAWMDAGTHDSLLDASTYVASIEKKQGLKIGCVEEVAYRMKFIESQQLEKLALQLGKIGYSEYLNDLLFSSKGA